MNAKEIRKAVQRYLFVKDDGIFGKDTKAAYDKLATASGDWPLKEIPQNNIGQDTCVAIVGKASSFADPSDITAFKKCKAQGKTDQQCFAVGDNGIGCWGDSTVAGTGSACALPPEDWRQIKNPRGKLVLVSANGKDVLCKLKDTMPRKTNIKNGAVIDLNPDAAHALGLKPPFLVDCSWKWA